MTAAEIEETAKELAAMIGDQVPQIADEAELRDYWEHVEISVSLRQTDERMALSRIRRRFEPPDIDAMRRRFEKQQRRASLRKALPARGTEKRRKQGARSRERVKELAEEYRVNGTLARHSWASRISKKMGLKARRVRVILLETGY